MPYIDDARWAVLLSKYAIRECKACTSMIANNGRYGRTASKADPAICDVCKPSPLIGFPEEITHE